MAKYHYKVAENKLLTPTVRSLMLVSDDASKPLLYEPGQYAAISLHDRLRPTTTRCFSIASSPTDRSTLQFCARVGGEYTSALERLKKGDRMVVRGPFGNFVFKEQKSQNLVFLAGGIGITPFMSMMRYATALHLSNNIHLVYSCRDQNDIPFLEELIELQKRNPHVRVTFAIGGGATDRLGGLEVIKGRVDEKVLRSLGLSFNKDTYMICGPSLYIDAMQKLLTRHNVPHARILSETFAQGSQHGGSTLVRWPANAYALSGLSLMAAGLFVVSSDLAKTLPTLEAGYEPVATIGTQMEGTSDSKLSSVEAVPPQVDTNITPPPVTKHIAVKDAPPPKKTASAPVAAPAPIPQPTPPPTPAPAPKVTTTASQPAQKPTVKPTTSRPKTRVS